jgi:hypothetical protein
MRVSRLIEASQWFPGYDVPSQPAVSVLMPTFRRGRDGLFLRAARSVLQQSLREIELIIIDDASTDGTADQIRDLMVEDGRVSCVHHPRNVGLPAVSEYEAYVRSRGGIIAFSFDDFLFEPDALLQMAGFMRDNRSAAAYGVSALVDAEGQEHPLSPPTLDADRLRFMNCVGNSAVMLSRNTVEDVGLYDPHIGLTRLCDWDLWRRIANRYEIDGTGIAIGRELGLGRKDSLGNSYPMHFEVIQELMASDRDEALRPSAFPDFDVWSFPVRASLPLTEHVREMQKFFSGKSWAPAPSPQNEGEHRAIASLVSTADASTTLYFQNSASAELNYITPALPVGFSDYNINHALRSDLVIVSRNLFAQAEHEVMEFCKNVGIPVTYFVDDNLVLLSDEDPAWSAYGKDATVSALRDVDAVIVTSEPLKQFFLTQGLHTDVHLVECVLDASRLKRLAAIRARQTVPDDRLRIGCFGGEFRAQALSTTVVPAIDALGSPVTLTIRRSAAVEDVVLAKGEVCFAELIPEFGRFLDHWARLKLDIIVHPAGNTNNIGFKTDNAALVALYIGAVPMLADEPAYEHLDASAGVEKVGGGPTEWRAALERCADAQYRAEMHRRLHAYCLDRYSGRSNATVLEQLLSRRPALDDRVLAQRYRRTLELFERRLFRQQ